MRLTTFDVINSHTYYFACIKYNQLRSYGESSIDLYQKPFYTLPSLLKMSVAN